MTKPDEQPKQDGAGEKHPPKARYVWQRLWFQWVLGTIVFFLFLSFVLPPIYWLVTKLSPVLTPVLLGLGLAYIFSPLTEWAQRTRGIKRPVTAGLILGAVVLVLAIAIPIIVASVVHQVSEFIDKSPQYAETVLSWFNSNPEDARVRIKAFIDSLDWTKVDTQAAQKALGLSAGALMTFFGYVSYAAIFALVTAFCFFVFSWKLEGLKDWFSAFIPKPYRSETRRILGLMDDTVSAIIRGRLIQSLVVMIVLSAGWGVVGVKYWLLLGILGGVLNLLPFAAILSWPLAVILMVVDKANGGAMAVVWAIVLPTMVYVIAQSLDGWVVEPLVQGKATGMDALTVLLVVLAGGSLLGLLGVVLAVPVAACIKILSQEILLPKARAFAEDPPDFGQKGSV
ncbi:MAG: AI-2E family transporter [Phycisphaeraceae bacterium]|nr:AI-2E family transporter [Phycisphaeraceae bacterium]